MSPHRRLPLPLFSGAITHRASSTSIAAIPHQVEALQPERLLIRDGKSWIIEDITVDGRSILGPMGSTSTSSRASSRRRPRLTGEAFDARSPTAAHVTREVFADRLLYPGNELVVTASYMGEHAGSSFEGCLFGSTVPSSDAHGISDADDAIIAEARMATPPSRGEDGLRLTIPLGDLHAYPTRLTLADADRWIVMDVLVNGRSVLVNEGELPGVLFSAGAPFMPSSLGGLSSRDELAIVARLMDGDGRPSPDLACQVHGRETPPPGPPRLLLPMSSGVNILPLTSAQIGARPRDWIGPGKAFQPRQIVIRSADDWVVCDVKVGRRSQFVDSGDIPGIAFSCDAVDCAVAMDPVALGEKLYVIVSRSSSPDPDDLGARFWCGVIGDVVRTSRSPADGAGR